MAWLLTGLIVAIIPGNGRENAPKAAADVKKHDLDPPGHLWGAGEFVAMVWLLTGFFVAIPPGDEGNNT